MSPKLINAQTESLVFIGSLTLQMTKTGNKEQSKSVTME